MQVHGWAIGYRTTSLDLPLYAISTNHHLCATSPCLPYQNLGNGDLQDGFLVPLRKPRVIQRKKIKRYKIPVKKMSRQTQNQWSNHQNLPSISSDLCRLQGWLVVIWKSFSNTSPARPPGLLPAWLSKAKQHSNLRPRREGLALTLIPLGSIATHQNAWPTNPISSRTCVSTTTKDKSTGSTISYQSRERAHSSSPSPMMMTRHTG